MHINRIICYFHRAINILKQSILTLTLCNMSLKFIFIAEHGISYTEYIVVSNFYWTWCVLTFLWIELADPNPRTFAWLVILILPITLNEFKSTMDGWNGSFVYWNMWSIILAGRLSSYGNFSGVVGIVLVFLALFRHSYNKFRVHISIRIGMLDSWSSNVVCLAYSNSSTVVYLYRNFWFEIHCRLASATFLMQEKLAIFMLQPSLGSVFPTLG